MTSGSSQPRTAATLPDDLSIVYLDGDKSNPAQAVRLKPGTPVKEALDLLETMIGPGALQDASEVFITNPSNVLVAGEYSYILPKKPGTPGGSMLHRHSSDQGMMSAAVTAGIEAWEAKRRRTMPTVSKTPSRMTSSLLDTVCRQKGINIRAHMKLPAKKSSAPLVPRFVWTDKDTKLNSTLRAAEHLQTHFAPAGVRVVAVPSRTWLEQIEVSVGDRSYVIRKGKTDIIFYSDNPGSCAMLDHLQSLLARDREDASRQRDSENVQAQQQGNEQQTQQDAAETEHSFRSILDLPKDTAAALQPLLYFIIGAYELKTHQKLLADLQLARCQAGAEHLQLAFTVSMALPSRHPGCMLVMGDLNANYIWMPIKPQAPSRRVNQIDAPDPNDDGETVSRAAALIKSCLRDLTSAPDMATINEVTDPSASDDNSIDEDDQEYSDMEGPPSSHGGQSDCPHPGGEGDEECHDPSPSEHDHDAAAEPDAGSEDVGDKDRQLNQFHRQVLRDYFAQPNVYRAFGHCKPMPPPYMELDRWSASLGAQD